jgi:hypothetical protein
MYSECKEWSCFPIFGSGRAGDRIWYEHPNQDDSFDWIVRYFSLPSFLLHT